MLVGFPDGLFQTVVTSPPYWGLRDYGVEGQIGAEIDVNEYISNLVSIFREVRRTLAADGTLWLNIGDSYTSGGRTWRDEDAKNKGRGMSYRAPTPDGLKSKDLIGIPWRVAFALQADGWYLRSDMIWNKPNCQPESVKDRPTRSHEYVFLFSNRRSISTIMRPSRSRRRIRHSGARIVVAYGTSTRNPTEALISRYIQDRWRSFVLQPDQRMETAYWIRSLARVQRESSATNLAVNAQALRSAKNMQN